jgi:hypothetical protein
VDGTDGKIRVSSGKEMMTMNESIAVRLDLIAAKAKQLALDYRQGKLWEGDLDRGKGEISEQLHNIPSERR